MSEVDQTISDEELLELAAFFRVASAGGFRAAARYGGVRKATLSRRVNDLESRLGTSLALRTTRSFRLTEEGEALLNQTTLAMENFEQARSALSRLSATPTGEIRVSCHPALADSLATKVLAPLLVEYPTLSCRLSIETRQIDLLREPFELAIRTGPLPDASLVARRIGNMSGGLYASPEYLKQHGRPQHPDALVEHTLLIVPWQSGPVFWPFIEEGKELSIEINARFDCSDLKLAVNTSVAGVGIVRAPEPLVKSFLQRNQLVPILEEFVPPPPPIYAVMPPGASLLPRVRAVLDRLEAWVEEGSVLLL